MTAITDDQRPSFDDCVTRYELALRDRDVSEWYELTWGSHSQRKEFVVNGLESRDALI